MMLSPGDYGCVMCCISKKILFLLCHVRYFIDNHFSSFDMNYIKLQIKVNSSEKIDPSLAEIQVRRKIHHFGSNGLRNSVRVGRFWYMGFWWNLVFFHIPTKNCGKVCLFNGWRFPNIPSMTQGMTAWSHNHQQESRLPAVLGLSGVLSWVTLRSYEFHTHSQGMLIGPSPHHFAHRARPTPLNVKTSTWLGAETAVQAVGSPSGRFEGSNIQGVGRWAPAATHFISYAPIFPSFHESHTTLHHVPCSGARWLRHFWLTAYSERASISI